MRFADITTTRQSCRSYDETKMVEEEKIKAIIKAAQLAPSACNGQPYFFTVCKGEVAKQVEELTKGVGLNKFATQAPVAIVVSEKPYVASAAAGAKMKHNDYRSIDIGIAAAYITAEATALGLGTCILGWFDDEKIRKVCNIDGKVRLVITVGYAKEADAIRPKKRKELEDLMKELG